MSSTLTRWDPFVDLAEMRSRVDRLLEDFGAGRARVWTPAVDVVREDGQLVLHADVPGFKPEEIKIEVRDGYLFISGEREETKEEKDKEFVRRERHYGSFSRGVQLPDGVDAKEIKARTHDGVLEVTIPLPKEASKQTVTITPTG